MYHAQIRQERLTVDQLSRISHFVIAENKGVF